MHNSDDVRRQPFTERKALLRKVLQHTRRRIQLCRTHRRRRQRNVLRRFVNLALKELSQRNRMRCIARDRRKPNEGQVPDSPRRNSRHKMGRSDKSKINCCYLLVVAVPVAQAQNPRVSKADAQKVVTIISGKLRPKPIAKYRNSVSRQSRPTRRKTTKWPMNCPRNAA